MSPQYFRFTFSIFMPTSTNHCHHLNNFQQSTLTAYHHRVEYFVSKQQKKSWVLSTPPHPHHGNYSVISKHNKCKCKFIHLTYLLSIYTFSILFDVLGNEYCRKLSCPWDTWNELWQSNIIKGILRAVFSSNCLGLIICILSLPCQQISLF